MRRLLVWMALLVSLVIPVGVGAQGGTIINELRVRLWPEYDRSELLVIYYLNLAPGTSAPGTVQLRVPADASVTAVAQQTSDGLFNADYQTGSDGEWQTLTFDVSDQSNYQIEYYIPIQFTDDARHFQFVWPGDYPVNTLVVEVQEPTQTADFTSKPSLPNEGQSPDNLPIHSGTFGSLVAGEQWTLDVDYSRSTDQLTVSGQPVQPSGGTINTETSSSTAIMDFLSRYGYYIIGFLGIVLIIGGLYWFWQSGSGGSSRTSRRRHTAHASTDSAGNDGQVYCHECGKRAQPADKFCRACGARLRREDS